MTSCPVAPRRAVLSVALAAPWLVLPFASAASELDDVLGGFDEPAPVIETVPADRAERWWRTTGSISIDGAYGIIDHRSTTGTDYGRLTKLRTRLNLQLDVELPIERWKLRASGFGWADAAYLVNGRDQYTRDVLDDYELYGDVQEAWIQGTLFDRLDFKAGRQVIVWGRSDNVRIVDVLNPLDNSEPGLADIEDLRRPLAMLRLDYRVDARWTVEAIVIPEIRFDREPSFGSDYFLLDEPLPREDRPSEPEVAAALLGIFSGWDVSLYYAGVYDDLAHIEVESSTTAPGFSLTRRHSRIHVIGAGGNYTHGSWLFKGESAWLEGQGYLVTRPPDGNSLQEILAGLLAPGAMIPTTKEKPQIGSMIGVEYYGWIDSTVAVEAAHRHLFEYEEGLRATSGREEDELVWSFRYTADWLRARLRTIVVALGFGEKLQNGAVVRVQADYTFRDALVGSAGIVLYEGDDALPLDAWDANDRVFCGLKYSF